MADIPPDDFDWVAAREACSAAVMFETLRQMAIANVERRNATVSAEQPNTRTRYRVLDHGRGRLFSVIDEWHRNSVVDFKLDGERIAIMPSDGDSFEATLTISDGGHCRFKVNGAELALWQLARRALEPLLFDY